MALLDGRAGRLTTQNAGFRPGQVQLRADGRWDISTERGDVQTYDKVVMAAPADVVRRVLRGRWYDDIVLRQLDCPGPPGAIKLP